MKTYLLRNICISGLLGAALAGCADNGVEANVPAPAASSPTDDYAAELARMGFTPDLVVDRGSYFQVDGDIIVYKEDLLRNSNSRGTPVKGGGGVADPRFHYRTTIRVADRPQIYVDLSAVDAENAEWAAAVRGAIVEWNSIVGAKINLVEGSPGDITVRFGACNWEFGTPICADYPYNQTQGSYLVGSPGRNITIPRGTSFDNSVKLRTAVHAFGHTLGLRHTNWGAPTCTNQETGLPYSCPEPTGTVGLVHIPGTTQSTGNSNTDYYSVMMLGIRDWTGFTSQDRVAARFLFPGGPGPRPTVTEVPGGVDISWPLTPDVTQYEVYYYEESCDGGSFCWYPPTVTETLLSNVAQPNNHFLDTTHTTVPLCWRPGSGWTVYARFTDGTRSARSVVGCQPFSS